MTNLLFSFGVSESLFIVFLGLVYLLPAVFVVYWMLKMLKTNQENLEVNKEILKILKENSKDL